MAWLRCRTPVALRDSASWPPSLRPGCLQDRIRSLRPNEIKFAAPEPKSVVIAMDGEHIKLAQIDQAKVASDQSQNV